MTDQKNAGPKVIKALIADQDGKPKAWRILETEYKPYKLNVDPPTGTGPDVYYLYDLLGPYVWRSPLPDVVPKKPNNWSVDAWNKRRVVGNDRWHTFYTEAGSGEPFTLKVSEKTDSNGRWRYEDFEDFPFEDAPLQLGSELKYLIQNVDRFKTKCPMKWQGPKIH